MQIAKHFMGVENGLKDHLNRVKNKNLQTKLMFPFLLWFVLSSGQWNNFKCFVNSYQCSNLSFVQVVKKRLTVKIYVCCDSVPSEITDTKQQNYTENESFYSCMMHS